MVREQTVEGTALAEIPFETVPEVESAPQKPIVVGRKPVYAFVKRTEDFILSLLASIVLLVPILVIALLIVLKDPGSPIYVHTRVGRDRKPIKIVKLRTMRKGADKLDDVLTPEQLEEYKREYKIRDDPRLIGWKKPGDGDKCFGARLRQLSLDEMMQIPYNVLLKGNMSLVGERDIIETTGRNVGFSRVVAA